MDLPRHGSKFNSMLDPSEGGAMGEFHARVKEHHSCHSAIGILWIMGPNKIHRRWKSHYYDYESLYEDVMYNIWLV